MSEITVKQNIRKRFSTQVETGESVEVQYDNMKEPSERPYIRFSITIRSKEKIEIGVSTYRVVGTAAASIYTRITEGEQAAETLAAAIITAFQGVVADGVKYHDEAGGVPYSTPVGRFKDSWRTDVLIPFTADVT